VVKHLRSLERRLEALERRRERGELPKAAASVEVWAVEDGEPQPLTALSTQELDRCIAALEAGEADVEVRETKRRRVVRVRFQRKALRQQLQLPPRREGVEYQAWESEG
jgi:hypothetical protein